MPAAGLTIAPLQPRYQSGGRSPESLVTLVMKCEGGGWLSGALASLLLGQQQLAMVFVEPFIITMMAVRDRVGWCGGGGGGGYSRCGVCEGRDGVVYWLQ